MNDRPSRPPAEALFQAWRDTDAPFDQEDGRARFLGSLAASRTGSRSLGRPQQAAWMLAAALVLCALGLGWWRAPAQLAFFTSGVPGEAGAWLSTTPAAELPLAFSEGTTVVLAADSRGRVEELDRTGAVFVLERGEVRANVVHRAKTDWRFRAGPFDVQVKGTQLDVTWNPVRERFTVRVDQGAVLVHGPSIGAEQTVRAGEICVVDVPSRSMRVSAVGDRTSASSPSVGVGTGSSASDAVDTVDASAATLVGPAAPTAATGLMAPSAPTAISTAATTGSTMTTAPAGPSWTKLEERGDYAGAYEAAHKEGFASIVRSASADDLLRLAQVSQLAGHGSDGHQALLALRRRFAGSEPAAVAAYELGRASTPPDAARWFGTYLTEAPAGPLAREAAGRRLEALASTGDAGARDAAHEYLARYPHGPQAPLATRLVSGAR